MSGVSRHLARLWPALALALALALVAPAAAQERPPDLPTYAAWVREAAAAARRGDRIGLEESGARLTAVTAVRLADGSTLPADNRWLAAELAGSDPDMGLAAARLGALADALALPPGAAPADAQDRLREILSRPPLDRSAPEPPRWWLNFLDWLGRVLELILRPMADAAPATGNATAWVVGAVGGLLLLGVLGYLLLGLRRSVVSGARERSDDHEARLTSRAALDQAGETIRAGDSRSAVRYLYLAALLWLDERGQLRYDRALTNREYLEHVRDNPELFGRLAPIVATFDRVWYGHAALSDEELERYRRQVEQLRGER
ncbi:MAG: hypothetical protein RLZZ387_4319 [Chloroflexota bacterium]|jgi:hypothetical protein